MFNTSNVYTFIGKFDVAFSESAIGRNDLGFDLDQLFDSDSMNLLSSCVVLKVKDVVDILDKFYCSNVTYGDNGYVVVGFIGSFYNMELSRENGVYICRLTKVGVSDTHINDLIDSKLGVIENGTY